MPGHPDEISQIEHLEQLESSGTHNVKLHVDLQAPARSREVRKAGFAVQAQGQDASGHPHRGFRGFERRCVSRSIFFNEFRRGRRPIEPVRVYVMASSFDLGKLHLTLEILIVRLKRYQGTLPSKVRLKLERQI